MDSLERIKSGIAYKEKVAHSNLILQYSEAQAANILDILVHPGWGKTSVILTNNPTCTLKWLDMKSSEKDLYYGSEVPK